MAQQYEKKSATGQDKIRFEQCMRESHSHIWEAGFQKRLGYYLKDQCIDPEHLVFLILYSAATRSAIYCPNALYALYQNLVRGDRFIKLVGNRTYFETQTPVGNENYNVREGSYCTNLQRYSMDISTCLLIYLFSEIRDKVQRKDKVHLFEAMRNYLSGQNTEVSVVRTFVSV